MAETLPLSFRNTPATGTESRVGQTLGDRYRLVAVLGAGSMGDVYLAEHVLLGRKLAVKVLKQNLGQHEELIQRFQQEAVAASSIGHENIVSVTDFGRTADGALYFVMELIEGQSLRELLTQGGNLPLPRALGILLQLCRALAAAHGRGIVHRDLKLDNVMVVQREDGSDLVKVLDFGISKVSGRNSPDERRITQAGVLLGTPDYMAPEQIRGEPADQRADVYSFGVLAYEVVTGWVPFEAPNITGVMMKHLTEAPVPPTVRRPDLGLPPAFDALVLKALEKDPANRFQDMGALRDALGLCFEAAGLGPVMTPAAGTMIPRATLLAHAGEDADGFAPTRNSRSDLEMAAAAVAVRAAGRKRKVGALAAGGAALAALLGAGAWWALRSPPPPPVVVAQPVPPVVPSLPEPAPPPVVVAPPPEPTPAPVVEEPPRPAPVRPAPPLLDRLEGKDVARVFSQAQGQLRRCLQDNRKLLPTSSGQLELSFTITGAGTVSAASLKTPMPAPIQACLVGRVKQLRFPKSRQKTITFDLPLDYALKD